MLSVRQIVKRGTFFLLGLMLVLAIAGCNPFTLFTSDRGSLATVAELPVPKLPDWIDEISPTGEAEPLTQVRIRFKDPLIPVAQLESSQQQQILKHIEMVPALPGQFRFLTPRMVGFQAEQALPQATRFRVTLKAGLADLNNHRLAKDLAWTFNTPPIQLTNLPGKPTQSEEEPEAMGLRPELELTSNTELELNSFQKHLYLIPKGSDRRISFDVKLKQDKTSGEDAPVNPDPPEAEFNPALRKWIYTLKPRQRLSKATPYQLQISPGLRPKRGNLVSDNTYQSRLKTYAPLAFQKLEFWGQPDAYGAYGRFTQGAPQLAFNNGLVAASARDNITVEPNPDTEAPLVRAYDGDTLVNLNPWAFKPATTYKITLGSDLKDQFGQTLGEPVTVTYKTGDVAADLWAPSDLNIFPSGKDLQLNLSAVNLPQSAYQAAFRVVDPTDLITTDTAYPRGQGTDLLPTPANWETFKLSLDQNQTTEVAIPLRQQLGGDTGMLAYGIKARTNRYRENKKEEWREPTFYGLVQLTNLGVFAQWFPQSGLVRVHHLADGSVAPNVAVDIYPSLLSNETRGQSRGVCASGQTDQTGTLTLGLEALRACMEGSDQGFDQAPELLVVAREDQDWAFVRTRSYSGYGYGLNDLGWSSTKPESRGTIYSDRQLYQPGETAWFTGAAYYLQNGQLRQDKQGAYQVTLSDPNGQKSDLGPQTTNDFGTFSIKVDLTSTQALGNYTLEAKGDNGVQFAGEFRVAEFKPPNFKVDLDLDQDFAQVNQTVTAKAQSNYLFGPVVDGGKVAYYVTRQPIDFTPKGWQKFSFGRQWYWPEEKPSVPSDVLQDSGTLSAQGRAQQRVKVESDLPYAMTYRVDVEVKDVSNLTVADSRSFTALPSDRLIGLQSGFVADANQPFPIEVIVTDPKGKAIAGERVQVKLQRMTYSSVTQVVEGSQTAQDQVEYETVATASLRSGNIPKTIKLTPPDSGAYRIQANFANAKSDLTASDQQIWATGPDTVSWGRRYRNNRLQLRLDKERYQPGDTATVLIQSPYPEAELYLGVIRHDTLYQKVVAVKGGAPQLQFQVTPEMVPNAAVEAVLVRRGQPLSEVEPGRLEDLVQIGFAPFDLDLKEKTLDVTVTPQVPKLQPQGEQTVTLQLQNQQGKPVTGQVTVMVVNEAVLQLTGYRPPDLVKTVYAQQDISTRFNDNRPDVILDPLTSPLQKGWGYSGGFSTGAGSTRIRTDFKALAYYNGSVLTDSRGRANITFTLPDDLTTWRVMAVATDGTLRFGQANATFITTKPLISNPVLPQFARPGDRFQAGLAVTNTTQDSGRMTIDGDLSGTLQFGEQDQQHQQLETKAPKTTQAYRLPMIATDPGEAQVQFHTQLGSDTDAFAVPLEVKPQPITEQVVETGTTTDEITIPIQVNTSVDPNAGGLEVSLASTLIPELRAPVKQVAAEADWPFLEPAASQLAIAAHLQTLSQQYGQTFADFAPTEQATQALKRMQKLQRPDGGFASWPGQDRADPFVSPYAAQSLAQAQAAGMAIDGVRMDKLQQYLSNILADPGQYDYCRTDLCKGQIRLQALAALADLGDPRNQFLTDLYALRDQFDLATQFKLAHYLSRFPDWQTEATNLSTQLQTQIYQTGRTARVNLPQTWRWLSSTTTTQAEALQLLIERQQPQEVLDRGLQGLLALRRDGTWGCSYDNAQALNALVAYSQLQPTPPNFSATAQLAGKTLIDAQFEGYQKPNAEVSIPMQELPQGRQDLVLQKAGEGKLHYLTALRYRLQGDQPGRLNGLRITRVVRPANQEQELQRLGLTAPEPLSVSVGEVFDIGLEIIADHPVDHVLITDPLPAGFEAVDTAFQTSTPYFQAQGDSWQIQYQTIHKDRIMAYGDRFNAGVYTLHYLVRSVTPGTFQWPGAEVHLQYAPEEFGRSSSSQLISKEES